MKKLLVLFVFFICFVALGQEEIDSTTVKELKSYEFAGVYRSSVSAHFGGVTGLIGFSYDFLLSRRWAVEVGCGYPATGFGFKFYPFKIERSKERFHIAQRSVLFAASWEGSPKIQHGLSFGLTFFATNRWNWGIDLGPMYEHSTSSFDQIKPEKGPFNLMFNLRAGYRFSFRYMKRKRELERGE
ncbi:MAG: hypothetical protein ABJG68_11880 [Crocinitomicaceae bacterium]